MNILLIDDNLSFRDAFALYFKDKGLSVDVCENATNALEQIHKKNYDVAFVDYQLPGMNGIELLKELKKDNPALEVIIITGHASLETAVEAGRIGAFDYLSKPFQPDQALELVHQIMESRKSDQNGYYEFDFDGKPMRIIGHSQQMRHIFEMIDKIAPTESTVLVLGESGTGKEMIARAIHAASLRTNKPFFAMDCGSLVESLFESELFGHAKGSFTGAHTTKHGAFELANKGTFFFDEIGNISLNVQAKILRAIQEKEIRRVGDTQSIKVDVRIIAATNRDLKDSVDKGTFREDLYYRISVIPIHLPPLRERKDDIPLLIEHFIQKHNHKRRGNDIQSVSDNALNALMGYHWPGNIRELENVIERAIVIEESLVIHESSLPAHIHSTTLSETDAISLADMEKRHIHNILEKFQGNISKSAKALQIDRKTLYDKIRKYDL